MNTLLARIVLWWNNVCPKHLKTKKTYYDSTYCVKRYWGKKCDECAKIWGEAKRLKKIDKETRKETLLERAKETLKPKEEQWQTISRK